MAQGPTAITIRSQIGRYRSWVAGRLNSGPPGQPLEAFRQRVLSSQPGSVIKARLYTSPELSIQVYRNDGFDTTNLILIHNGRRVHPQLHLDRSSDWLYLLNRLEPTLLRCAVAIGSTW
jgi:hypothetical protein